MRGAPDVGLAFNVLAPPTEELAAGYVPAANKIYLIPVSCTRAVSNRWPASPKRDAWRLHRRERLGDIFKAFALGVDAEEPCHETSKNHHPGS